MHCLILPLERSSEQTVCKVNLVEVTGGLPRSLTEGLALGHASYSPVLNAICHCLSAGPKTSVTNCRNTIEERAVYVTHCYIPGARNVDSGIALQLGPSEVAAHRNN